MIRASGVYDLPSDEYHGQPADALSLSSSGAGLSGNRTLREAQRDKAIARLVESGRLAGLPASEILERVASTRNAFAMSDLINSLGGVR